MAPQTHLSRIYRPDFGLLTDLYQLTTASGYWQRGLHGRRAVFHLFYRRAPFGGRYAIAAGLELAVDLIRRLAFSVDDIQYLGALTGSDGRPLFSESFLNYLQRLRFTGDVYAVPEGTIVLPHEPILRIEAPLPEAQLIETGLLTLINFSTLIATKAARVADAAGSDEVFEFGLRRAQGIDGALTASRSAYLGGCHATSNVWAGRYYGIPVRGTHAHAWVMTFDDERAAFREYAAAMPNNCVFLVDTYDTLEGVANAIEIGRELRAQGRPWAGIRLDSGDLAALSIAARRLLDEAGFPEVRIIASDDLDEQRIAELKAAGAPIAVWGVGTRLVTGHNQSALGGVYKLAALERQEGGWSYRVKKSEQAAKTSIPGILQTRRYLDAQGHPRGHAIFDQLAGFESGSGLTDWAGAAGELPPAESFCDLLQPIIKNGELVYNFPSLNEARAYCRQERERWAQVDWAVFRSGLESRLYELRQQLTQ